MSPQDADSAVVLQENERLRRENRRLREDRKRLKQLLHTDQLTGLLSRHVLGEMLTREIAHAQRRKTPLSVAMADADHFRRFNNQHGHAAGDAVLAHIGAVLRGVMRKDEAAVRHSGDEFAFIFRETDGEHGVKAAERLRLAIAESQCSYRKRRKPFRVTLTFGVAEWHGDDAVELLGRADEALYKAKRAGRNCVRVA